MEAIPTTLSHLKLEGHSSVLLEFFQTWFLPVRRYAIAVFALIVCPSVTSRSCSKTAKRMIVQTIPNDSQRLYADDAKDLYESPKNAGSVGKNCVFSTDREVSGSDVIHLKFVSIRHSRPPSRRCAGGGIRSVVQQLWWQSNLTVQLTSTSLMVYRSLWMTSCTPSHARCAIVEWCVYKTVQVAE